MVVKEEKTKILFSSDLFIQQNEGDGFVSVDASDDLVKAIHSTKYLPSKKYLINALDKLSKEEIEIIAPMHGKAIKDTIDKYFEVLRSIDLG